MAPTAPRSARTPAAAASPSDIPSHVTLITGDRITMRGAHGPVTSITAAPGRQGVRFHTVTERDRLLVIPTDVQPLIAAGVLDRRLFDVTGLVELGYDDDGRADLPVLITRAGGVSAIARSTLSSAGAVVRRALPSIGGEALSVPKGRAAAVWASLAGAGSRTSLRGGAAGAGVKIWLDGRREIMLDHSAAQIGAPIAWEAGYTGAGVTIAVLDTGIDPSHPDFAGRIAAQRNFMEDGTDPDEAPDFYGHGTHVASIAAGSGAAEGGLYRGIAPDAAILVGKVCEAWGCPESGIIAGMEWAAQSGARVVNMSLGGGDTLGDDPMEQAVNALSAQYGTLFVAAAGNAGRCGGPDLMLVSSPGTATAALSVGAVDPDDALAEFSCIGPRLGDAAVKPEITAPGVAIAAARAVGTPLGDGNPVDDFYTRVSGTSMATPHVTGAAALVAQQHPDWRAPEIKAALMGSALPGDGIAIHEQGSGRVDVGQAIAQTVLALPPNLVVGSVAWPHDDDEPIAKTLTYRNLGGAAVDLTVSVDGVGPDGGPAPTGMFTVAPESVAVPPGGEASVTVTVDTRGDGPDGGYLGMVVASGGGLDVRTPIGVNREIELHDVVLRFLDRQGQPSVGFPTVLDLQTGESLFPAEEGGVSTVRLPPGQYAVDSLINGIDDDGAPYGAVLAQPLLDVTAPTEATFDARTAEPDIETVPDQAARPMFTILAYARMSAVGPLFSSLIDPAPDVTARRYLGHVGPEVAPEDLKTILTSTWAHPADSPRNEDPFFASPTAYHLVFGVEDGRFPTGFVRHVALEDLAAVEFDVAAMPAGRFARLVSTGSATAFQISISWNDGVSFETPARRTELFTTEETSAWTHAVIEEEARAPFGELSTPASSRYEPGRTYRTRWNHGVLAPSFPVDEGRNPTFFRADNFLLVFDASPLSDDAEHRSRDVLLDEGQVRLFHDGELLGQLDLGFFNLFNLPPEDGDYRLELETVRDQQADRSTRVQTAWTFRSAMTPFESLPLLAVRYDPPLDRRHRAPGGVPFVVPLSIQRE
ncbi:MAG TPA: S8 family serine peptidase, partial [Kofleriaceae bacterium]|nr:S8 family serine peptidase [Kofleriaceae bacterium]